MFNFKKFSQLSAASLPAAFILCGLVSCNSSNKEAFVGRPADPNGASKVYDAEEAAKNTSDGDEASNVKTRPNTFVIPGTGTTLPNDGGTDPNSGDVTKIDGCALNTEGHDFVEFPWPDYIQKCVDQNLLYDFHLESCSTVPAVDQFKIAEAFTKTEKNFDLPSDGKFDCNWVDALKIQQDYIGISSSPIGEQNRTDKTKLVGCSEVKNAGYYMIILQYWIPTQQDIDACKVISPWQIHTSCRQLRESANYPELTWQECLRQ